MPWGPSDIILNRMSERITVDPDQLNGQPCIRGLRITVRRVLEALAVYPDRGQLFAQYPELEEEDVQAALAYAVASVDVQVLESPAA